MSSEESVTLPPDLHAPARARTWLVERVPELPAPVMDDALLVASELVTNAVRHGRPEIALSVRRLPDGVRIAVRDEGEHVPVAAMDDADRRPARPAAACSSSLQPHATGA